MSPDPDPAAGNPFAYAADEPLDLIDPTGHYIIVCSVVKAVTTAAKKVAKAVTTAAKKRWPASLRRP